MWNSLNVQVIFSENKKKYFEMSSATVLNGALWITLTHGLKGPDAPGTLSTIFL